MAKPDLRNLDAPLGPPRDWFSVSIASSDYENENGFYCLANAAGDLVYQTLGGSTDQPAVTLAAGEWVGPKTDHPGLLKAVRSNTTVGSITVVIM